MTATSPSRTPHPPTPAPGAAPSRRAVFRPRILGAVLAAATLLLARPDAAAVGLEIDDGVARRNYPENSTAVVSTYTAADLTTPNVDDAIEWSVGGTDGDLFDISSSGELTFNSPPDFEDPQDANQDNIYRISVAVAYVGIPRSADAVSVTITVTDENEPLEITGATEIDYPENSTAVVETYTASDPEGGAIRWAVTGPDSALFTFDTMTGALTFNSPPDFEDPQDDSADNTYAVTLRVTAPGNREVLDVTVTVTNENPEITGATEINYPENGTMVVETYTAASDPADSDPEDSDTEDSDPEDDPIEWDVMGPDSDLFTIDPMTGALTFNSPPDFEDPLDDGADNTYAVTVNAADSENTSTADVTVTVTNENPEITGATEINYPENGTMVVETYTAASDTEGDDIEWDVGGTDGALFAISSSGELTFNSPPDFEDPQDDGADNTYAVTVNAEVDDENITTAEVTVTVTNENPEITGATEINYPENETMVVETYTAASDTAASDPENDPITWAVTGPDSALFTFNPTTGELTFNSPPDFEMPQDDGADNTYAVTLQAADSENTTTAYVTVTVTDVNEAPVITGPQALRVVENTTRVVGTYTATDPEGAPAALGMAGPDSAFFTLAESGELTFQAPPGGAPRDANQDNVYEVAVVARDAGPEGTLAVAVRVTPPPATDTTRPRVTLHAAVATHLGTPFGLTIRFSEPVSGFRLGAIAVQNGTAAQFRPQSPQTYTVTITPAPAAAAVQIAVGANGAQDRAGNGNRPATLVVEAAAALVGYFESPAAATAVAGIDLIRGWVFASAADVEITTLVLYIDGQPATTIPCCSARLDVAAAYPALPATTTTLSGWGVTYNWGELPAGPHTLRVVATSSQGRQWESARRQVEVLKPGDVAFADRVSLATATARLEDEEVELRGVVLRDQASQQEQTLTLRYAWQPAAQGLRLVETRPAAAVAAAPGAASLLARLRAGLTRWGRRWLSPAAATAATGLTAVYEAPADGSVVAGVGLVRGWAFSELTPVGPRVALRIDGTEQGPVPCCSARPDVAAAHPGVAGALTSGWGLVFNYGNLEPGAHTLGVRLTTRTAGGALLEETLAHTVTVVRLGGYAFVDEFDLRAATVRLEDEVVVLSGVVVRDKATQATQVVEVRLRWTAATQGLRIVGSEVQPYVRAVNMRM